jgi:hypothetical protein
MEYFIVIIILAVLFFFWQRKRSEAGGRSNTKTLRREYSRRARLPSGREDEYIDSYILRLQEKYPARSETWYLEKMLFDLERDKR